MLVEAVYQILANDPGVQAALGTKAQRGGKDTGVFLGAAPSNVKLPYVVYQLIHTEIVKSYQGTNAFQRSILQFSCYAASSLTAHKALAAVKNVLNSVQGEYGNGGSPVVITPIESAFLVSERDLLDEGLHGTVYGVSVDYEFCFVDLG